VRGGPGGLANLPGVWGGLTFRHGVVGELLGVAHVPPPLPLQLQEDGDRAVDLGLVVGGRAEDDGVLRAGQTDVGSRSGLPRPARQPPAAPPPACVRRWGRSPRRPASRSRRPRRTAPRCRLGREAALAPRSPHPGRAPGTRTPSPGLPATAPPGGNGLYLSAPCRTASRPRPLPAPSPPSCPCVRSSGWKLPATLRSESGRWEPRRQTQHPSPPRPVPSPRSLLSWMGSEMMGWRARVKFPLLSQR